MRKHVYCESKFLETCISKINNWQFSPDNFEELQLWMCVKTMIFSQNIILHLDITDDDLPKFDGVRPTKQFADWQKEIAAKINTSEIHLRLGNFVTPKNIDKSDNTQLTAYYLTCCDSKTCQNCMDECGVLAICPDNIKDFKDILYDNGAAIKRDNQASWDKILKFTYCNSMIIVDNYILKEKNYAKNLQSVFSKLLPECLTKNIPFQLYIITILPNYANPNEYGSLIKKIITQIRPKLQLQLSLFPSLTCDFHDRIIISNNIYISCGSGFNLFKMNYDISRFNLVSSKTTTMNILYPFFPTPIKWVTKAYSNFLEDISKYCNDAIQNCTSNKTLVVGEKQNRLCEMIK